MCKISSANCQGDMKKTTMISLHTWMGNSFSKEKKNIRSVDEDDEKLESWYNAGREVRWYDGYRKYRKIPQEIKGRTNYNPETAIMRFYPRRLKSRFQNLGPR